MVCTLGDIIKYNLLLTLRCTLLECGALPCCRAGRLAEIKKANQRYAEQHLKNSSTRGVLAAAFTAAVADDYMTGVMFDTV